MRHNAILDERFFDIEPTAGRLLSIAEVCALIDVSRSMIYKSMKEPHCPFPAPLKIGSLSRWRHDDIIAWSDRLKSLQMGNQGRNLPTQHDEKRT